MGENTRSGGVYHNWHNKQMKNYMRVPEKLITKLESLPRYPDYITAVDKNYIENIAKTYGVDISKYELDDPRQFSQAKGEIEAKIHDVINKELKPEDPDLEFYKNMFSKGGED